MQDRCAQGVRVKLLVPRIMPVLLLVNDETSRWSYLCTGKHTEENRGQAIDRDFNFSE